MGWLYGFKLHLIVNYKGEIVTAKLTAGNVHDAKPVLELAEGLTDRLYGDKGYIGKALESSLFEKGVTLVTNVRRNMKLKVISRWDGKLCCRSILL